MSTMRTMLGRMSRGPSKTYKDTITTKQRSCKAFVLLSTKISMLVGLSPSIKLRITQAETGHLSMEGGSLFRLRARRIRARGLDHMTCTGKSRKSILESLMMMVVLSKPISSGYQTKSMKSTAKSKLDLISTSEVPAIATRYSHLEDKPSTSRNTSKCRKATK